MIGLDVNTWIGGYPWRPIPHPEPAVLARVLDREGIARAWVGHLPSAFWRDPTPGNAELYAALAPFPLLDPAPTIRPDWPDWSRALTAALDHGVAAIRVYPQLWGMSPGDASLTALAGACADAGRVLVLTVRFEDSRQRHPLDVVPDLTPAHVRALARDTRAQLVVVNAGREFIEEVAWALEPIERTRVRFDFSWVWGPPEEHLATLIGKLGPHCFVYGTGWPLRLTQNPRANLDLLPRELRERANAHFASSPRELFHAP